MAAALILILLLFVSVSLGWLVHALSPSTAQRQALHQALSPKAPFTPTNVLLVGVDRSKKGTRRADTLILARIDPLRRRAWLLSIPRDTNVGLDFKPRLASPACQAALGQANLKSPDRSKASDGIMSSEQHDEQSPLSDHRWGYAFDLTDDPQHGIDCAAIAESLRRSRDDRVDSVIFNGRYFSAREGWRWLPYRGSSSHDEHMHVSIRETSATDTRPWPGIMYSVDPTPVADAISLLMAAPSQSGEPASSTIAAFIRRDQTKINKAYSFGGPAATIDAVEHVLDMPVHHYAEIDFRGLTDVVDALGGVTVDVPIDINDRRAADASPRRRAQHLAKGEQHIDGEHALTFVRSREAWDADFGRVRNQQQLIKAAVSRTLSPGGLLRLPAMARAIDSHAMSDMSAKELAGLMIGFASTSSQHRTSATLVGRWQSPIVQTDQARRLELVRNMAEGSDFLPLPSEVTVTVLNGSGRSGAGKRVAFELARRGLIVTTVTNAEKFDYTQTVVVSRRHDEQAGSLVAQTLPGARKTDSTSERFDTRVLVIVGRD